MTEQSNIIVHLLVLGLVLAVGVRAKQDSVFPDRSKPPGHLAPRKCWWAKEITPDLHVAGRLTERQIKYASEAGFKSIVSLYDYPGSKFGNGSLPDTAEARRVAEELAGLEFKTVLESGEEWASVDAVKKLSQVLPPLPKPVLLFSDRGYSITFVTLLYLANQTRQDPSFSPKITSKEFYNMAAAMGLDFTSGTLPQIVSEITDEPVPEDPPKPDAEPEDWLNYWLAHPVYKNWFTAGQITKSQLPVLVAAGFKTVVNLRPGLKLDEKNSQEEVNLLNIKSDTNTYSIYTEEKITLRRQAKARLEETRIDPGKPNHYISPVSSVNYENKNVEEFGDEVGYHEPSERKFFRGKGLGYIHLPIDVPGPYQPYMDMTMTMLQELGQEGPVLVHCAIGKRAAYITVLVAAVQHNKNLEWALRRTRELGFAVTEEGTPEIYKTYVDWLVTKRIPPRTDL